MSGPFLGGRGRDATRRWTRWWQGRPAGEGRDQGRGHGKQRGRGPRVDPASESDLYSVTQEATLPSLRAQERPRGADGKVSPDRSLRHSQETRSRMRRQHLK